MTADSNQRRLAWFTDLEMLEEIRRREDGRGPETTASIVARAVEAEREACAKIADDHRGEYRSPIPDGQIIADAIRAARGRKP